MGLWESKDVVKPRALLYVFNQTIPLSYLYVDKLAPPPRVFTLEQMLKTELRPCFAPLKLLNQISELHGAKLAAGE